MHDDSSDKLSALISKASAEFPKTPVSPEERVERALEKALANTTPERAGCSWDRED